MGDKLSIDDIHKQFSQTVSDVTIEDTEVEEMIGLDSVGIGSIEKIIPSEVGIITLDDIEPDSTGPYLFSSIYPSVIDLPDGTQNIPGFDFEPVTNEFFFDDFSEAVFHSGFLTLTIVNELVIPLGDVNINFKQLCFSKPQKNIEFLNSTSTKLPFANNSVDRVLALESAQHFKPLHDFITESKRVLIQSGFLVMAIPITVQDTSFGKLGLLKFTWSSEHYSLDYLKNLIISTGFKITDEMSIGSHVYDPLADYYVKNNRRFEKFFKPLMQSSISPWMILRNKSYAKKLNMWAYSRVDTVRDSTHLDLIKSAGINWLALGIESGEQRVRQEVTKGRFQDIDIRKVVRMIEASGIEVIANYLFGLPSDNIQTMQTTLDLGLELCTAAWNGYAVMALPGSDLYRHAREQGHPLPKDYAGYSFYSYDTLPIPVPPMENGGKNNML